MNRVFLLAMGPSDHHLVKLLREGVPLAERPYEQIAKLLDMDPAEILLRISKVRDEGVTGPIRAFFEIGKLGYRSTLVAMKIPPDRLESALAAVGDHPGVFFICSRSHVFNFWFSLAVPKQADFDEHVSKLHQLTGSETTLSLPVIKKYASPFKHYKEPAESRYGGKTSEEYEIGNDKPLALTDLEMRLIGLLQEELPLTDRPFLKIASEVGLSHDELFRLLRTLNEKKLFDGIRASGNQPPKKGNHVICWKIPEEKADKIGNQLAEMNIVRNCYERPYYSEMPYTIYAAVKAETVFDFKHAASEIKKRIGAWPQAGLFCTRIFKRKRLKVFGPEWADWDRRHGLSLPKSDRVEPVLDHDTTFEINTGGRQE